jgi:hypothetical protein
LGAEGWSYDGATATTLVRVRRMDLRRGLTVTVEGTRFGGPADGFKGALSRLQRVMYYSRLAMSYHVLHPQERLGVDLAQTGNRISRQPARFAAEMRAYRKNLAALPRMLKGTGRAGTRQQARGATSGTLRAGAGPAGRCELSVRSLGHQIRLSQRALREKHTATEKCTGAIR